MISWFRKDKKSGFTGRGLKDNIYIWSNNKLAKTNDKPIHTSKKCEKRENTYNYSDNQKIVE